MLYAAVLNLTAIRNREIADDAVKKMIRILSEAEDKDFEQYAEEHKNEIRAPEKDSWIIFKGSRNAPLFLLR